MRRRAAALAGVLVITPLIATAGLSPAVAAAPETVALGDYGVWTVPAGVTSITIELTGGDGGTATKPASAELVAVRRGCAANEAGSPMKLTAEEVERISRRSDSA